MKNLKYAYLSINKKLVLNISIIIQLVIISYLMYSLFNINSQITIEANKILEVFNNKKSWYMKVGNEFVEKSTNNKIESEKVREAYSILKNNKNFKHLYLGDSTLYLKEEDSIKSFRSNPSNKKIGDINYIPVRSLNIDRNTYSEFGLEIENGRPFNDGEFTHENNIMPIILGFEYSNIYNLGDVIEYASSNNEIKEAKVIGFLKENFYLLYKIDYDDKFVKLDNAILTPYVDIDILEGDLMGKNYLQVFDLFNTSYFLFDKSKNDEDILAIMETINEKFKDLGLGTQVIDSTEKYLSESLEELENQKKNSELIVSIAVLFLSIGIISSYSYSIKNDKKQYGVHILNGATLNDICIRLFEEVAIVFLIGFIGSIGIIRVTFTSIEYKILAQILEILFIINVLISIIPTIMVRRLNINELIKEGE